MKYTYKHTLYASYLGYITQAIVINLTSLLFIIFETDFMLTKGQIGFLISFNFCVQIATDFVAARVIDHVGFRKPVVAAHIFASVGLILLAILPGIMQPYAGLLIAVFFMAIGGGLTEVLISPIVEALPGEEKASAMSLLHSFYSWGLMAVVLLSTAYFAVFGLNNWRVLPVLWAIIPAYNIYLFAKVPLRNLVEESHRQKMSELFKRFSFWLVLILMVCSGAAEQAMSQWSSLFAEVGLNIPKAMGDLLGPCMFALLMGIGRTWYGIYGAKVNLSRAMFLSAGLGIVSYLTVVFSSSPVFSLIGCAVTGLAVALMWPGMLSLSAKTFPRGGSAMFALLALAGDLGCSIGPGIVGLVADGVERGGLANLAVAWFPGAAIEQVGLRFGLLAAIVFPLILLLGIAALRKVRAEA